MLVADFECQAADIDEELLSNEQPSDYVCRMSAEKAAKVWIPGTVILSAAAVTVCTKVVPASA